MPVTETVATAVVAFAATNVDDVVVLSVLFARRNEHFHTRHIVTGQYLGFAALIAASLAAGAGLLALPDEVTGALGLIPIALGVRGFRRARRLEDRDDDDQAAAATVMTTPAVASITIANGADNVAIYAPLFATTGRGGMAVTLVTFFVLIGVWCAAGRLVGARPATLRVVNWAGHYAIPVVLIALGSYILASSGLPGLLLG